MRTRSNCSNKTWTKIGISNRLAVELSPLVDVLFGKIVVVGAGRANGSEGGPNKSKSICNDVTAGDIVSRKHGWVYYDGQCFSNQARYVLHPTQQKNSTEISVCNMNKMFELNVRKTNYNNQTL